MEYGRKYQAGNFYAIKFNKTLRKSEVAELRDQMGIPMGERKKLQRSQLPYIKVHAVSGVWSVEFCCNTAMYRLIDEWLAGDDEELKISLAHMFSMMYTDTMVAGDAKYLADKARAMKSLMERSKATEVSDEEDEKIIGDLKADEESKATLLDMAKEIGKGGGDDE